MLTTIRTTVVALSMMLPFATFADDAVNPNFKTECVSAWMKGAPQEGKVDYQNFGEQYCGCAAGKSIKSQDDLKLAAQTCMAQTVLRGTMDNVEEKPGLSKATADDILSACIDTWAVVNPQIAANPTAAAATKGFCVCAQSKLADLAKNNENITDDQWYLQIDAVSAGCAEAMMGAKPPADSTPASPAPVSPAPVDSTPASPAPVEAAPADTAPANQ